MRNEIGFWVLRTWEKRNASSFVFLNGTKTVRSGVYYFGSVLTRSEAHWYQVKGAEQHVAQKSDRFILALFVIDRYEACIYYKERPVVFMLRTEVSEGDQSLHI